jgi:TRAP transporter TAXI family solute receptor
MRRRALSILVGMVVTLSLATGTTQAQGDKPVHLRFATVGLGSSWYIYGAGIASLLRPELPKGSTIDVLPIAGGIGNAKLLQSGEAELALGFNVSTRWACRGEVAFDRPLDKIRSLVGGLDVYYVGVFVTERSGITSIEQIRDRKQPFRLLTVPLGGAGEFAARQVLAAYGMSYDWIKQHGGTVRHVGRPATVGAFQDGTADAWIHTVDRGHPIVTELTTVTAARVLSLSADAVDKLVAQGWDRFVVPANSIKGQTSPILTVNAPTNLLAAADLPEPLAHTLTRLIVEKKAELVKVHAAIADFDPARAADPKLLGCPLHPGAERYYREKGLLK